MKKNEVKIGHIYTAKVTDRIVDVQIDATADGVHPTNLGHVVQGSTTLAPCTAQAVFEEALLEGGVESATTELVLSCIQDTRPTLTARIIEEFQQDIDDYARV